MIIRLLQLFVVVPGLLWISGCATDVIHGVVVDGYPSMAARYPGVDPVGGGNARVILYLPDDIILRNPSIKARIDGKNASMHTDIGYQTAEIIDLPADDYSIWVQAFQEGQKIGLQAQPGAIYCYSIADLRSWAMAGRAAADVSDGGEVDNSFSSVRKTDVAIEKPESLGIEECMSRISSADVRCAHKDCLPKTVTPRVGRTFEQYSKVLDHDQLTEKARSADIGEDVARIYITRDMFTLGWVSVGLDAKPDVKIEGDSFVVYEVAPGMHTVTASIGGAHDVEQAFSMMATGGRRYFFSSDSFRFLSEVEGQALVNDFDLLENGYFRSGDSFSLGM